MIKGSIQEEDITIVNLYEPNIGTPRYIRQTLADIKGEIDSNKIIVGDFNTLLTPMDTLSKHKINKEMQVLNDTLNEMDLIDVFRTFHSNAEECTFFPSAHGTFSRIDHILGHKLNLSKFKKIEIISSIFSNHKTMILNINYKKKSVRNTNTWQLNNTFLNSQQVTEEIKREIKDVLETNDNEDTATQNLWDGAKAVLRGKFIAIKSYFKKQRKTLKKHPNFYVKQLEKEGEKNKISRRKEIINIQEEINEKEMKETIVKINKIKAGSLRR